MGTTASGKSKLAMALGRHLGGEIISADSVAFYRGFNVASAKPSDKDRKEVEHHLVDVLDPHESSDVGWFSLEARRIIQDIHVKQRIPLVVGGSGLYLRGLLGENFHQLPSNKSLRQKLSACSSEELITLLERLDPGRAKQIHKNDHFRLARACEIATLTGKTMAEITREQSDSHGYVVIRCLILLPKPKLNHNIQIRTQKMMADGLLEEVEGLLKQGAVVGKGPMKSIGYKQAADHLQGNLSSLEDLEEAICVATRQLAKKQRNWFQNKPHDLFIDHDDTEAAVAKILSQYPELLTP